MLSNAYFLAKFRFDTAENEPAKNLQKFANFLNFPDSIPVPLGPGVVPRAALLAGGPRAEGRRGAPPCGGLPQGARADPRLAPAVRRALLAEFFHQIADFSHRVFTKILRLQRCKTMQIL